MVIVGGGKAAGTAAATLRGEGYGHTLQYVGHTTRDGLTDQGADLRSLATAAEEAR
jgi:hypothetical protein